MSAEGLEAARTKMADAGVQPQAIEVFTHYYHQLEEGVTGLIAEDSIEPLTDPPMLSDVEVSPEQAAEALGATAIIKLNGGLGTSMGMERAKSLLPVRGDRTFLDLIVEQVLTARETYGARLPLLFMDSFRTHDDTLAALAGYDDLPVEGLGLDFQQNQEPKLLVDGLTPVEWPADPSLEWCPPGHGDLYTTLEGSGVLDRLLELGYRYASVSNSDNLGAAPDATIAGWFAATGAPYAAEVCRRTPADRKGGHLAVRKSDGQLILRDTAQTAPDEMHFFTDEHRHPFFHCNNLWFDLAAVSKVLKERNAVLGLPLIKNVKNVDPSDSSSPEVVQIESAMGAAIEVFPGATAIGVGRERFLPVKTTNDLMLLRSDVYDVTPEGRLERTVDPAPLVDLDSRHYKTISRFDAHFPADVPSLREAQSLTVKGDWTFEADVRVVGAATLEDEGSASTVPSGTVLGG
ncbi:UTP--glucose-1-phosphate uridylyltransferase [Microlunatus flavus]|uniref:UTP--glucose-1-phosphate uridylyltransferase n=1 Tax=Microlunatus flavus TaxID=1036181 RepID=A0A1H9JZ65_9ACTN|nr:UTP--glucose-1-phosphate uridylyltransferase [Microlunatus flavus]SEQ92068.1 UTP--glucose-1-phosphate uridylyltransferase [Microlunatus flavus]